MQDAFMFFRRERRLIIELRNGCGEIVDLPLGQQCISLESFGLGQEWYEEIHSRGRVQMLRLFLRGKDSIYQLELPPPQSGSLNARAVEGEHERRQRFTRSGDGGIVNDHHAKPRRRGSGIRRIDGLRSARRRNRAWRRAMATRWARWSGQPTGAGCSFSIGR